MINPKTFREELKTLLAARTAVQNIDGRVFRYPPGKQADRRHPTIYFDQITDASLEDATLLGDAQAVYQITGGIAASAAGSSDDDYGRAETLAWTLMSELVETLEADETVNGEANHTRVTSWSGQVTQDPNGNLFYDIEFTVTAWFWP